MTRETEEEKEEEEEDPRRRRDGGGDGGDYDVRGPNSDEMRDDFADEEGEDEEETRFNRFGRVAARARSRGRGHSRGQNATTTTTTTRYYNYKNNSEEEEEEEEQQGRGHAPSSEDEEEELSRSDNDTQMSVDSDTEGGVGLIDDNDNYEKSNNRLREREPNKIYADSQLANGELERVRTRSQHLQRGGSEKNANASRRQGWYASNGGSGSSSSSSSEEDEGEEILQTSLDTDVFPLEDFNSVVSAHNSYRHMRSYQGYYPTKMFPCLKYINYHYACLYDAHPDYAQQRPEEAEAIRKFLSQGIIVSNFHTVLEELKASAWPTDSLLFQYTCLEMCCEAVVLASRALDSFCHDRIISEACSNRGHGIENALHVPHDPHKYPRFRRTVGLSVDDDENLEELARACEIEELTALLNRRR